MKHRFKKNLKVVQNNYFKYCENILEKYPNLEILKFNFNTDDIWIHFKKNNKIKSIFFENIIKIDCIDDYFLSSISIKDNKLIINYKNEYNILSNIYNIDRYIKDIKKVDEKLNIIKINNNWIKDNVIIIPECNTIRDINICNKDITLDLRNVKDYCYLSITDNIRKVIINNGQNIRIDNRFNNDFTLVIQNNKIDCLESENIILNYNEENKKEFKTIYKNPNGEFMINYIDRSDYTLNEWDKRLIILKDLKIFYIGYAYESIREEITYDQFNEKREYKSIMNFIHDDNRKDINKLKVLCNKKFHI